MLSQKSLRFLYPSLIGAILLSQFNNCENFSSANLDEYALYSTCAGTSCYSQNADNLELDFNVSTAYSVASTVQYFDISGYCNEGGFPRNRVIWELMLNNIMVNSSQMTGNNTTCVNGRFQIRVDLGTARIGLKNPSNSDIRTQYGLDVEVIGIDSSYQEYHNTTNARKRLILNPI